MLNIKFVLSKDGKEKGKVVGLRKCTMSGCSAYCLGVRWADKKLTYPCMKGMKHVSEDTMQIID